LNIIGKRGCSGKMVAEVYLLQTNQSVGGKFTYGIKDEEASGIRPGVFVKVPFGSGNTLKDAVVWSVSENQTVKYKLKYIKGLNPHIDPISEKEMHLAEKMQKLYLCPMGDCIKCLIPPEGNKGRVVKFACINGSVKELEDIILTHKFRNISQIRFLEYLKDCGGKAQVSQIIKDIGCTASVANTLEKNGYINIVQEKTEQSHVKEEQIESYPAQKLTEIQQKAYNTLEKMLDAGFGRALLHGVTGSGKTEIYLQLIERVIEQGGNAIVLVPEISLTPQMSARFTGRFGDKVAILHSRLSNSERNRQWKRIRHGEIRVVLGARSAVFAPFEKINLIILDEEHELTYKSEEQQPRYHAGEIAALRCKMDSGLVILGSATPSVGSFYQAHTGKIEYISLSERVNNKPLPGVEIIDMRMELNAGGRGIFSGRLIDEIRRNLESGQQTVLFVHRRGFSGHVVCTGCGKSMKCGKCNIPMTYHSGMKRLICHYCGNTAHMPDACPGCGTKIFSQKAFGTQKVQEELSKLFPEAKIVRMDADTTLGKEGHAKVIDDFVKGGGDIIVGTQMIAKGHDFPNVTLVGVISADSLLNAQDYRAGERAFQLLTQVAGRAGRGNIPGRVIVQAFDIDSYVLEAACHQDYEAFYRPEINLRKQLNFPPFCTMAVVGISGTDDRAVFDYGVTYRQGLSLEAVRLFGDCSGIEVLGLTRASVPKINNKYRWRILIKAPDRRMLLKLFESFKEPKANHKITGVIKDINPGNVF